MNLVNLALEKGNLVQEAKSQKLLTTGVRSMYSKVTMKTKGMKIDAYSRES